MSGKARGRARGRARGSANGEHSEPPRRPGEQQGAWGPPPGANAAWGPPPGGATNGPPGGATNGGAWGPPPGGVSGTNSGPPPSGAWAPKNGAAGVGRATNRGGTRPAEPRPGPAPTEVLYDRTGSNAAAPPTDEMKALSFNENKGEQRRRTYEDRYSDPRTRPDSLESKKGSPASGSAIQLLANYFRLRSAPNWHLYQYHVGYSPEVDHKRARQRLLKEHRDALGLTRAFDGMVLFMPRRLPQESTEFTSENNGTVVTITVKLTNELPPTSPTCLQVYNIIFKRILKMINMQQIGRNYYNEDLKVTIPQHKMEVWPGFITSILQMETEVMLSVETSHKVMRTDTVWDILNELYIQSQRGRGSFPDLAFKRLVGEIVLTKYNNKTYRIDDIDWDSNPGTTFNLHDGSTISFAQYYAKSYNEDIKDLQQPLLVSNPKKRDQRRGQTGPLLLVPELCVLTGLSDDMRSDFNVMKDLAVHTRLAPERRQKTLQGLLNTMNENQEVVQELTGWGFQFEQNLVNLPGRILKPEVIQMHTTTEKGLPYKPADADWGNAMRGQRLVTAVELSNWMLLFTRRDRPLAQAFLQTLMKVSAPMGSAVREPQMFDLADGNPNTFIRTIKDNMTQNTQMVVCVLPTNRKDCYDSLKKLMCVERPVPSQMVLGKTLNRQKMLMSITTKIAIQLNCKLGGEIWTVPIPLKGLMIVGIDVYHDSAKKGRSVGAFVASMNQACTRYYSKVTFQHNAQELMNGLRVCMTSALKNYHQLNGALPDRIIIYRDGVGEGQLPAVVEHEIPQVLNCFQDCGTEYKPKCSVVIVSKRINSRFFAKSGGGRLDNPPPGTVIDDVVTRPEAYDFFLVSQSVRQGTVTPTRYNIVWDTMNLGPDKMQRLTYKMTHLYFNWPGTIRVPAPCQYAHKLAFLVGQSLHVEPSPHLANKLYFL